MPSGKCHAVDRDVALTKVAIQDPWLVRGAEEAGQKAVAAGAPLDDGASKAAQAASSPAARGEAPRERELESLPLGKQWLYAIGQLGWSVLSGLVGLQLVYFYLPPKDSETGRPVFPVHVTQKPFFAIFNIITLLATAGRLWDAVTDPIIAGWSDNCQHRWGRRIPFLAVGALPSGVLCVLLFMPPVPEESVWNIVWLAVMQCLFYLFFTVYVTPYFSLLAELGHTAQERLNLSTWASITFAIGTVIASSAPTIGSAAGLAGYQGLRAGIIIVSAFGVVCMYVPVFCIDERRYCRAEASETKLMDAIRSCLRNPHFRPYVAADFSYWFATAMIMTGMPYFVQVLVQVEDRYMVIVVASIALLSFCLYYPTNWLASRCGKKPMVLFALSLMTIVFGLIFFLGWFPLPGLVQIFALGCITAIPLAILGILPNAILADIANYGTYMHGQSQEGIYFAARGFLNKLGQSCGVMIFASLTNLGKDVGDDLGIRLTGPVGVAFCLLAVCIFSCYKESEVLAALPEAKAEAKRREEAEGVRSAAIASTAPLGKLATMPDHDVWGESPVPHTPHGYPVASRGFKAGDATTAQEGHTVPHNISVALGDGSMCR
eukprot:TRINITY_DN112243_c0_g1_i1.p1 TRINITY_DN112243_c0_g1~~TRINITY_DN112243_c0_g1_i1.p1  ORF type:complete len:604 (-),score=90.67 TRINITY_DN112243_c0_g1_i1:178-1989(-)